MDAINTLIEGVKLEDIMPDLQVFLDRLVPWMAWAVRIGPMALLAVGLLYLYAPPKEANHSLGFRTYFGMGSVEAWQFTQQLAGKVLSILGGGLTLIMWIISFTFRGVDAYRMMNRASTCLIVQIVLMLAAYIYIRIVVAKTFDKDGNLRK